MHCNDNPQAIEVADRKREQGDQGAGGPPRDANEDSIMLPTAALETSPQVPSNLNNTIQRGKVDPRGVKSTTLIQGCGSAFMLCKFGSGSSSIYE